MTLTEPQQRMLRTLAENPGSMQRELLFHHCGAHASGHRTLEKLAALGLVTTTVSGSYLSGSDPVTRAHITVDGKSWVKGEL